MGGTGLVTVQSTRPLLPLSPRSEHRARPPPHSRRYAHGRAFHSTGSTHSRLFMFYSSYIDLYTTLFPLHYCNISFATICRPRWKKQTGGPRSWSWGWWPSGPRGRPTNSPRRKGWRTLLPGCKLRRVLLCLLG